MSPRMHIVALALASIAFAAPQSHAAFPTSPNVPSPLPGASASLAGCPDGAGGAFVVAQGYFGFGQQIRLYREGPNGSPAGGWPAAGIVLADTSGSRGDAVIAPDGSGGVFVAWEDGRNPATSYDIFMQHVTAAGAIGAGWPARGIQLSLAANMEYFPQIVGDGVGGVLVVWGFLFSGSDWDVYGARVTGAGAVLWNRGLLISGQYETSPIPVLTGGQLGIAYMFKTTAGGATNDIKMSFHNLSDGSTSYSRDICTAANDQYLAGIATGAGDVYYVLWRDGRTSNYTIYSECMQGSSQISSGWPFNDGLPVADGGGPQGGVRGVVDAQNDLWAAISDSRYGTQDVFVQRLATSGIPAPGWPASGLAMCTAADMQTPIGIDIDGAQEAVLIWTDRRSGSALENDVYGTRIRPDGLTAPGFLYGGQPLATEVGAQQGPGFVVGDPAGGAYVAWSDGFGELQHLDRFGALGDVAPHLTSVRDVAGDQGGAVRLQWNASPYDAEPLASIASYWVWRATPMTAAQATVTRGGRWAGEEASASTPIPGERLFKADAAGYAWEYLTSLPASLMPAYSYVAATASDSTAGHDPWTAFMVEARSVTTGAFWSSPADSGHSVDNLAPPAPAPFVGTFAAGTSSLVWGAPAAADLAGYVLHRGSSSSFVPGPASLVASPSGLSYVDAAGAPYYYKVAAADVHGNIGPYATVLPAGALVVDDGGLPAQLAFALAGANPVRTSTCVFRLAMPSAARVRVSIVDVGGRLVRTLMEGTLPAGRHEVAWDGRDAGGSAVHAGLYLAHLEADGRSLVQRIARLP